MSFSIFINFNGNCREAVTFYAGVFGPEMPKLMTYADAPPSDMPFVRLEWEGHFQRLSVAWIKPLGRLHMRKSKVTQIACFYLWQAL